MDNKWKTFNFYQRAVEFFFITIMGIAATDKLIKNPFISFDIIGYLFWLSLGIYLGFILCRTVYPKH